MKKSKNFLSLLLMAFFMAGSMQCASKKNAAEHAWHFLIGNLEKQQKHYNSERKKEDILTSLLNLDASAWQKSLAIQKIESLKSKKVHTGGGKGEKRFLLSEEQIKVLDGFMLKMRKKEEELKQIEGGESVIVWTADVVRPILEELKNAQTGINTEKSLANGVDVERGGASDSSSFESVDQKARIKILQDMTHYSIDENMLEDLTFSSIGEIEQDQDDAWLETNPLIFQHEPHDLSRTLSLSLSNIENAEIQEEKEELLKIDYLLSEGVQHSICDASISPVIEDRDEKRIKQLIRRERKVIKEKKDQLVNLRNMAFIQEEEIENLQNELLEASKGIDFSHIKHQFHFLQDSNVFVDAKEDAGYDVQKAMIALEHFLKDTEKAQREFNQEKEKIRKRICDIGVLLEKIYLSLEYSKNNMALELVLRETASISAKVEEMIKLHEEESPKINESIEKIKNILTKLKKKKMKWTQAIKDYRKRIFQEKKVVLPVENLVEQEDPQVRGERPEEARDGIMADMVYTTSSVATWKRRWALAGKFLSFFAVGGLVHFGYKYFFPQIDL